MTIYAKDGRAFYVKRNGTLLRVDEHGPTITEITNYIYNPLFANNRSGWSLPAGVFGTPTPPTWTLSLSADKAPNSLLVTTATAGAQITETEGEEWTIGLVVTIPSGAPGALSVRGDLFFTSRAYAGEPVTLAPGESARLVVSGASPVAGAQVYPRLYTGDSTSLTGRQFTLSDPVMFKGSVAHPFFHGDTPDTATAVHSWTGTTNASPSLKVETTP